MTLVPPTGLNGQRPTSNGGLDMDQKNLADLYHLPPIPWSRALAALESFGGSDHRSFLATTRPDGRPHLAGVGVLWDGGKAYFVSGGGTRKSRNLAENASCAISMSLDDMDLVIEGRAERVTDDATLQRLAKRYAAGGWPARVEDGAFTYDYSAPSAGPPPWNLYEVTPTTIFGVLAEEPGGATRWRSKG
jgi:nitroimidazol reductase NimA-like FMN-containing flavoprotein (pyridoxamine 5'-phosphate oxidase superfamily)